MKVLMGTDDYQLELTPQDIMQIDGHKSGYCNILHFLYRLPTFWAYFPKIRKNDHKFTIRHYPFF